MKWILLFVLLPTMALADTTVAERGTACITAADHQALINAKATDDQEAIDHLMAKSCGPLLEGATVKVVDYPNARMVTISTRTAGGVVESVFWVDLPK